MKFVLAILKKYKFELIYFPLVFSLLLIIVFPSLFFPPISDDWHLFYFFHQIEKMENPSWLHVLNYDPFEQMRYQPASRVFYYILYQLFGSNFFFFKFFNLLLYCLSAVLLYRLSLFFSRDKITAGLFITYFLFLFTHFDMVLWSHQMYITAGLNMFFAGFIFYINFLKAGNPLRLLPVILFFLLGLWCYEPFIFWPAAVFVIPLVFKAEKKGRKHNIIRANFICLGIIYGIYAAAYFFTRLIGTYSSGYHRLGDFTKLPNIITAGFLSSFNLLYNNILVNIFPALAFPLTVEQNIYLGGPVIDYIERGNESLVYFTALLGILCLTAAGFFFWRRKRFARFKKALLFLFFPFSTLYIIFFCRIVTNRFVYGLTEFRYQLVPNAFLILAAIIIFSRIFKNSQKKRGLVSLLVILLIGANIFYDSHPVDIYQIHFVNLKRILFEIKDGINKGYISKNNKVYISCDLHRYLPSLCWNVEMDEKFMKEGSYKWMFSKEEMPFFAGGVDEAQWVIDEETLSLMEASRYKNSRGSKKALGKIYKGKGKQYSNIIYFYTENKNFKKAEEVFTEVIGYLGPEGKCRVYNAMGYFYKQQNLYKKAEEMFKKAIASDPADEHAYTSLGHIYNRQGKFKQAGRQFGKAIELCPGRDAAYEGLGNCFWHRGLYKKAEEMFQKTISLNPKSYWAYTNLGHVYNEQGKQRRAAGAFRKAIRLCPDKGNAYEGLGNYYWRQGNYRRAEEMFQKTISLNPKSYWAYTNLGHVYNEQGKQRRAAGAFRKAIRLCPDKGNAYEGLGNYYWRQGNYRRAEEMFKKAISLNPQSYWAHTNLGHVYNEQGKKKQAVTAFKKAIESAPEGSSIKEKLKKILSRQKMNK